MSKERQARWARRRRTTIGRVWFQVCAGALVLAALTMTSFAAYLVVRLLAGDR